MCNSVLFEVKVHTGVDSVACLTVTVALTSALAPPAFLATTE